MGMDWCVDVSTAAVTASSSFSSFFSSTVSSTSATNITNTITSSHHLNVRSLREGYSWAEDKEHCEEQVNPPHPPLPLPPSQPHIIPRDACSRLTPPKSPPAPKSVACPSSALSAPATTTLRYRSSTRYSMLSVQSKWALTHPDKFAL
jgi:hypothetical protein